MAVLNKELSLTAAAVRLGVDTNTFFAHITDNGKNKQRVAQLMSNVTSQAAVPNLTAGLGILSEHAASLLAEHHGNLDVMSSDGPPQLRTIDLMTPENLRVEEEGELREHIEAEENEDPVVAAEDLSMENPPPEDTEDVNEDDEVEIEEKPVIEDPSALMVQYESQELLKNGGLAEAGLANGEDQMEGTEEEEDCPLPEDHRSPEDPHPEQGEDLSTNSASATTSEQTTVHQAFAEAEPAVN